MNKIKTNHLLYILVFFALFPVQFVFYENYFQEVPQFLKILSVGLFELFSVFLILLNLKKINFHSSFLLILLVFGIGFLALDQMLHFYGVLLMLLFYGLFNILKEIKREKLVRVLIGFGVVVSLISIFQFLLQNDLGMNVFNEVWYEGYRVGLASFDLFDLKLVRSYGPFVHPNLLAYFLCLVLFLLLRGKKLNYLLVVLVSLGLIFSFSRLGCFAALVLIAYRFKSEKAIHYFIWPIAFVLLLRLGMIVADNSFMERFDLVFESFVVLLNNPLGVGYGSFGTALVSNSNSFLPWSIQPVHNVFLLILIEFGIFLGGYLLYLIYKFCYKYFNWQILFIFVLFAFFDHFFWDLKQGVFLGLLTFLLMYLFKSKSHQRYGKTL